MKQIISCLILLCANTACLACNVCGGSGGNQYLGLLPQQYKNFIGFQYQHREFVSEHPVHGETNSTFSREDYTTMQLWARSHIGKRIQLLVFAPYVYNLKTENHKTEVVSGLGDVSIIANYNIILPETDKQWNHFLQAGIGLKAPTGSYNQQSINFNAGLPNMQPGTKSWDYTANANYTLRRRKIGLNADIMYSYNTVNPYGYKYGNKLNGGVIAFCQTRLKNVTLMPQVGCKTDITGKDYDNYRYKWENDMTGGHQVYTTMGFQAFYSQLGLQCVYSQPVYQRFAGGLVTAKYKIETGIYFLF